MSYIAKFVVKRNELNEILKTLENQLKIESFKDDKGNITFQDRLHGISIIFHTPIDQEDINVVSICPERYLHILEKTIGKPKSAKKRKIAVKTFVKTLVELYEKEKLSPRQALTLAINFFEIDNTTLKTYANEIRTIGSSSSAPHELRTAYKILKNTKVL